MILETTGRPDHHHFAHLLLISNVASGFESEEDEHFVLSLMDPPQLPHCCDAGKVVTALGNKVLVTVPVALVLMFLRRLMPGSDWPGALPKEALFPPWLSG